MNRSEAPDLGGSTVAVTTPERTFLFHVLGPVKAIVDEVDIALGGPKQLAVWGILVSRAGTAVDRDVLIEGVWGEDATDENRRSLHTYLSNLRALTGVDIARSGSAYTLRLDSSDIDAFAFEEAVDDARSRLTTTPADTADALRTALSWWRGRPYANASDTPGLQAEIRRLEELRLQAVELRVEADLAAGNQGRLVPELEALVADHPMRERLRYQQMLALYRDGRQADALRAYRRAVDYLAQETGLEPTAELQNLEMRILQQDEKLLVGVGQSVTERRAFLFTDIEDSTLKWDANPDAMGQALKRHDEILTNAINGAHGKAFKHTGDGMLAAFSSVGDAVQAAEKAQRSFANEDWGVLSEIKVRMGIDYGDVDARGDDFFGPPLNRCSRIMNAAHGGQVLLSMAAQEELTRNPIEGVQVRFLGEHRLRGLSEAERISQLVFIGLQAEFPELRVHIPGPDPTDPEFGDSIRGYELRERIGVGTFGVVYRAYQSSVGREVAIKVIRPEFANHPAFVRRFETEAKLVAQLAHPHIVPLFDFWRDQAGAYLVMQLMRGGTLRPLIGSTWTPQDALHLVRQVGSALGSAHRQEVVHRDLKPANVLLDDEGNAYLADFGIAARILDPAEDGSLSSSAPRYRAPEEAAGEPADHRSDIFSLGVLTFELLTAERVDDRRRTVTDVRPDLPEALNSVIGRATATKVADRFASTDEFLDALATALGDLVELPAEAPSRTEIRNPYKGLRPFMETDHGDFYGRDGLVETLTSALERHRIVTVVGPSGSGKSSTVRAGLMPQLRAGSIDGSQDWLYVTMKPGTDPFESLTRALESVATEPIGDLAQRLADSPNALQETAVALLEGHGDELVVAIDQFEEVFTLVESEEERDAFLRMVAATAESPDSRVRFILTLRADFYDRPLGYEHIGPHVSTGQVTVIPPTRGELIEAIERPADAVGLRFEPGLAARIASDVAEQPGGLPLMQYALTELVDGRDTDLLTASDYDRIGGVTGALGRRAEQVYRDLPKDRRHAAREILLRLVTVDENADDTRRRAKRRELEALDLDRGAVSDVVEVFGRHRLLSFDRDAATRSPTVEVAHESLLREWSSLRGWIEEQRGNLVLGNRFRIALSEWEAADRAADFLLTGDRIAPFAHWASTASLTAQERDFLDASRRADERSRVAARRRRRVLTGVLAGATVVSLAFGAFALVQRNQAIDNETLANENAQLAEDNAELATTNEQTALENADEAERQASLAEDNADLAQERAAEALAAEALAEARELAASAINVLEEDPELAVLLTLQAIDASPAGQEQPVEVINALWKAGQANRLVDQYVTGFRGQSSIDLNDDGSRLVVAAAEGASVQMYDTTTGELMWERIENTFDSLELPAFQPEGNLVAVSVLDSESQFAARDLVGADDMPARILILDVATKELVHTIELGDCGGGNPVWTADGTRLTFTPDPFGCMRPEVPGRYWVEFFDATSWESVAVVPIERQGFASLTPAFTDAGEMVVFDVFGPPVIFTADLQSSRTLDGIFGSGDVSSEGSMLVLAQLEQATIGIYDAATGAKIDALTPNEQPANLPDGTVFSADDKWVLAAYRGGDSRVWNVQSGELEFVLPGGSAVRSRLDADRQRLYTANDAVVKVWNLGTNFIGAESAGDLGPSPFVSGNSFGIGPELGAFFAADPLADTKYTRFFNLETGQLLEDLQPLGGGDPVPLDDGRFIFYRDGAQVFFDPRTGDEEILFGCATDDRQTCRDSDEPFVEWFINASLDGSELSATREDGASGVVLFLDPQTGEVQSEINLEQGADWAEVFTKDWIIGQRGDSTTFVVDRATGEDLWSSNRSGGLELLPSQDAVAIVVRDFTVLILEFDTWKERTIDLGFQRIRGLSFSPDGSLLAVGDEDDLHIVDLARGELLQSIPIPLVSDVHWLGDTEIVLGSRLGLWITLDFDTSKLIEAARSSVSRTFTAQECLTYRIDPCPAG